LIAYPEKGLPSGSACPGKQGEIAGKGFVAQNPIYSLDIAGYDPEEPQLSIVLFIIS
jgi:hypothetical protein